MDWDSRCSDSGKRFRRLVRPGTIRPLRAVVAGLVLAVAPLVAGLGAGRASAQTTPTGSVTGFGDATAYGAPTASQVNAPVAGMARTPDGGGYWLVGADGGIFTFGNARFYGSEAGQGVQTPFVGVAPTPDGHGYWVAGESGNIYNFGDAPNEGSVAGEFDAPVVGIAANPNGVGYWLVGADGVVFSFGDANFYGSMGAAPPSSRTPVVAMASTPDGHGYWLATTDKQLPPPTAVPSVLAQCNDPGAAPSVEPATISLACGDGNASLTHLTWTSWTKTTAAAIGDFTHNTCTPDCARGTFVSMSASVRLGYPMETSAGQEFASFSYVYADPSAPGGSLTFTSVAPTSAG